MNGVIVSPKQCLKMVTRQSQIKDCDKDCGHKMKDKHVFMDFLNRGYLFEKEGKIDMPWNVEGLVDFHLLHCNQSFLECLLVARRVTLVIALGFFLRKFRRWQGPVNVIFSLAFGFLLQYFRRWQGPMNTVLSLYDCRLSCGNTQTLPAVIEKNLLFALTDAATSHLCRYTHSCLSHLVTLSLTVFSALLISMHAQSKNLSTIVCSISCLLSIHCW